MSTQIVKSYQSRVELIDAWLKDLDTTGSFENLHAKEGALTAVYNKRHFQIGLRAINAEGQYLTLLNTPFPGAPWEWEQSMIITRYYEQMRVNYVFATAPLRSLSSVTARLRWAQPTLILDRHVIPLWTAYYLNRANTDYYAWKTAAALTGNPGENSLPLLMTINEADDLMIFFDHPRIDFYPAIGAKEQEDLMHELEHYACNGENTEFRDAQFYADQRCADDDDDEEEDA